MLLALKRCLHKNVQKQESCNIREIDAKYPDDIYSEPTAENPLNISPQEWKYAQWYFGQHRDEVKMRRKSENIPDFVKHSFIKIEGVIYAMDYDANCLGAGGFGKVKLVQNTLGNLYALKIEDAKGENRQEVLIMKELGCILGRVKRKLDGSKLLFPKNDDRRPVEVTEKCYTLMPLKKGEPLSRMLRNRGFTPLQKWMIARECCLAIKKLHNKRIIHGDINPGNFMVDIIGNNINIDAIDFGISKMLSPHQSVYKAKAQGVPIFMAPEIRDPSNGDFFPYVWDGFFSLHSAGYYSFASDVYALGIMIEHELTLHAMIIRQMRYRNVNERPSLKRVIDTIDDEIHKIIAAEADPQICAPLYEEGKKNVKRKRSDLVGTTSVEKGKRQKVFLLGSLSRKKIA